jgi:hypothetical protein
MDRPTHEQLQAELRQFRGTAVRYQYHDISITEGVKYLAERAGCYWLVDIVCGIWPKLQDDLLVICELTVNADQSAVFIAIGDEEEVLYRQRIPVTDFPGDWVKLWFSEKVLFLPNEY